MTPTLPVPTTPISPMRRRRSSPAALALSVLQQMPPVFLQSMNVCRPDRLCIQLSRIKCIKPVLPRRRRLFRDPADSSLASR